MTEYTLALDFTGLDTQSAGATRTFADVDASCRPSGSVHAAIADPAADVFALAALLGWLLTARPLARGAG